LPEGGAAGVLGLSYKPNTDVIEESQGLAIAQALLAAGLRVVVYDPAAMENAKRVLSGDVIFAGSAEECVRLADVVAITTPWAEFQDLPPAAFQRSRGRLTVLDCWRVLPEQVAAAIERYIVLGKGGKLESFSVAAGMEKLPREVSARRSRARVSPAIIR
jgi:UDPglucose 6-dehydrogenase